MRAQAGGSLDPLQWARHPKSAWALDAVKTGAECGDAALQSILADLVERGICTPDGRLLQRWDGLAWVRAVEAA